MTKVAHLADLHLGYSHLASRTDDNRNQRQVDFEQSALTVARYLAEQKPDLVLVAGDLLHDTNMYPAALAGAVRFCRILQEAKIPLLAIGGNHDEAEAEGRYNGLLFLQEHADLQLLLRQDPVDIKDLRIHPVSYRIISRSARSGESLKPFQWSSEKANILLAHGYAAGEGVAPLPEGSDIEIPQAWLEDSRFAACLLGHIHTHKKISERSFYAGSLERRNFGESSEEPAFWIHNIEEGALVESTSVKVSDLSEDLPRPMIDLQVDAQDLSLRELDEKILELFDERSLQGTMMRIKLREASSEIDKRSAAQSWEKEFRRRGGMFFEAVVETREIAEALGVQFSGPPQDIRKGFLDFLQQSGARQELLPLAEEALEEAQERIIAQEGE